jgi:hypothetical protein
LSEEVFRVEDERGDGPYRNLEGETVVGANAYTRMAYDAQFNDNDDHHPAPFQDGLPDVPEPYSTKDFSFGFDSVDSLKAWFDEPRRAWLRSNGYKMVRYCVDLVSRGIHQLAFLRKGRKKIAEEDLPN